MPQNAAPPRPDKRKPQAARTGLKSRLAAYQILKLVASGRYLDEAIRLLVVLDDRLRERDYVSDRVSVADFAIYPWVEVAWQPLKALEPDRMAVLDAVEAWLARMARRPGVEAGMQIGGEAMERPGRS